MTGWLIPSPILKTFAKNHGGAVGARSKAASGPDGKTRVSLQMSVFVDSSRFGLTIVPAAQAPVKKIWFPLLACEAANRAEVRGALCLRARHSTRNPVLLVYRFGALGARRYQSRRTRIPEGTRGITSSRFFAATYTHQYLPNPVRFVSRPTQLYTVDSPAQGFCAS